MHFFLHYFCNCKNYYYICTVNSKQQNNIMETKPTEQKTYDLSLLSIQQIAQTIPTHCKVHRFAEPYWETMLEIENLSDTFGVDSGREIVLYFLANAKSMTGDFMRSVKIELNNRLSKEAKDYGRI